MERILVVGDAHGNSAFMEKQIRRAGDRGIGTLLQLGDFGVWPGRSGVTYLDAVSAAAVRHGVDVRFIDGNHEDFIQLNGWLLEPKRHTAEGFVQLRERLCWIPRGTRWEWDGVSFGALGGAFSIDHYTRTNGLDWWAGLEEPQQDDLDRLGDASLDVLVTHDAPLGAEPAHTSEVGALDEMRASRTRRLLADAVA